MSNSLIVETPRIPLRWVTRENGNRVLQFYVPEKNEVRGETHHYWRWEDVPEFAERIEEL